jgi:CubicO group peptidase (beta-lactamase class C family)
VNCRSQRTYYENLGAVTKPHAFLVLIVLVSSVGLLQQAASADELASAAVYSVAEVVFVGPHQSAADAPARDYAMTGGGSGYITRAGKLVLSWGDLKTRYVLKSTTKSFGATALGLAVLDGKIALTDKVTQHHPTLGTPPQSNAETGWIDQITILHLATQTAGAVYHDIVEFSARVLATVSASSS